MNLVRKSPTLFGLFLFLASLHVSAETFYEKHLRPTFIRASDTTSFQILLAGGGSTVFAHQQDSAMRDGWSQEKSMSKETSGYGYHYGQNALGAVIALTQYYFDPENGASHIRAIAFTAGVTQSLKFATQRERPNGSNFHSFPSGHTSDVFATATSLTYAYGWKAGAVAYPFATFVALSRVADDAHWLSDTVAGAFIGVWMGRATFQDKSGLENSARSQWQWIPVVQHRFLGLNWVGTY